MKKIKAGWVMTLTTGLGMMLATGDAVAGEATPGKIVYIRENIPSVPLKPYSGQTYEDTIPDTLDIAERADLAINALTGVTNPLADHELYWLSKFDRNPPVLYHDWSDWCGLKFMEALPLLRMVNGSTQRSQVDKVWQDVTLKCIGPDGLYYIPLEGRPWGRVNPAWCDNGLVRADGSLVPLSDPSVGQFTHPQSNGRMIGTMLVYYLRDGNPIWKESIERMIDRSLELAIHKDDYCYYPNAAYAPNVKLDPSNPKMAEPKTMPGGEINGRLSQGSATYYKLTGYPPARELAEKTARYTRFHDDYFGKDGEFLADKHFHAHTIYLLGMLELGLATGDKEMIEFVRKSYEWGKRPEIGSALTTGFFPEWAKPDYVASETCAIADMIALALKFSAGGVQDYYPEAERWTRNHFAESQLIRTDWIEWNAATLPRKEPAPNETSDQAAARSVGAFAGWSGGSDWWVMGTGIQQCCTGNATRTIYYIWDHILRMKDGELRVNMLLNRASPWADVYSYIPYEGQVDLKIKKDCQRVLVHAPEWIEIGSDQITATVDGVPRTLKWDAGYVDLGAIPAGKTANIRFPIAERVVTETMGTVQYRMVVKGNTVVRIDPPGTKCPLYQRDHYRENQVRWRKVKRFVSDDRVEY